VTPARSTRSTRSYSTSAGGWRPAASVPGGQNL